MRGLQYAFVVVLAAEATARSHHHRHLHRRRLASYPSDVENIIDSKDVENLIGSKDVDKLFDSENVEFILLEGSKKKHLEGNAAKECLKEKGKKKCKLLGISIDSEPISQAPQSTTQMPQSTPRTPQPMSQTPQPASQASPPASQAPQQASVPQSTSETPASLLPSPTSNMEFPDGQISCSKLPTEYGAVKIDQLQNEGWSGIQKVAGYPLGHNRILDVANKATGGCTPGHMCSYACPPGQQKTQWPEGQPENGVSVGGLYCNSDNTLRLTRPSSKQLCEDGVGGIYVENKLDQVVVLCRTDYPGTEGMVIPHRVEPKSTRTRLSSPSKEKYYHHQGMGTSAQHYLNMAGVDVKDACVWNNDDPALLSVTGDNSPAIIGAGNAFSASGSNLHENWPGISRNPKTKGSLNYAVEVIQYDRNWSNAKTLCTYKEPNPTCVLVSLAVSAPDRHGRHADNYAGRLSLG